MADQKISADPSATDLVGAVVPIVQAGLNKKAASTLFQTAALGYTPENVANKDTDGSLAANSDTRYASQKATKTYSDANLALAYAYTDSAIAGNFSYRGTYDGSSGNFPTTGGRGTSGVPAKGDAWEILSACTIQGIAYDQGDIIVSKVNTPGQTTGNWGASEHNTQQATTSMRGTAMVVDTTTIQTPGTTDDLKMVTAIKFWQGIATLKGQTNTWTLAQTFSAAPVFSSVSANQYLKVDGSKALTSIASIPDSDLSSNVVIRDANGNTSINNNRDGYNVQVSNGSNGVLFVASAKQQYITGSSTFIWVLPAVSTLQLGHQFYFTNLSSGNVTIQSSGSNTIQVMGSNSLLIVTCVSITGTGTASWSAYYQETISGGSYLKVDGSRALTANWAAGNFNITGIKALSITGAGTTTNKGFQYFQSDGSTVVSSIQDDGTHVHNSTWTAAGNNQINRSFSSRLTMRGTASDNITDTKFSSTVNVMGTSQNPIGIDLSINYVQTGGINTTVALSSTVAGMTATTYTSVAPASTSGSGTGALFTVVVGTATTITSITQTTAGSGYKVNETITFNGSQFGAGSGTAIYTVRTVTGVSIGTTATPLRIGIAGINGQDTPKLIDFYHEGANCGSFRTVGGGSSTGSIKMFDGGGTEIWRITPNVFLVAAPMTVTGLSNGSTSVLNGAVTLGVGASVTSNYVNPVNGVSTSSAYTYTGTSGGIFAANNFQSKYRTAGTIGAGTLGVGIPSAISLGAGGTGYTTGLKATTGGTGTGFQVNVATVSGGVVTSINFSISSGGAANGSGYTINDVLTISTGGANATLTVTAIDYAGTIIAFDDVNSFTDAKSNNIYVSYFARPIYNITSTQVGSIYAFRYAGTHTALGSFNQYNFVYENSGSRGGIGNASPLSTWDINGSLGTSIVTSTGNLTLDATHYTVIITSGTGTYTLTSASAATRRIYIIVNQTGSARTISTYKDKAGASQTTIAANSALWLQTEGTNWYQIN